VPRTRRGCESRVPRADSSSRSAKHDLIEAVGPKCITKQDITIKESETKFSRSPNAGQKLKNKIDGRALVRNTMESKATSKIEEFEQQSAAAQTPTNGNRKRIEMTQSKYPEPFEKLKQERS
jgi:hypothetical protein